MTRTVLIEDPDGNDALGFVRDALLREWQKGQA